MISLNEIRRLLKKCKTVEESGASLEEDEVVKLQGIFKAAGKSFDPANIKESDIQHVGRLVEKLEDAEDAEDMAEAEHIKEHQEEALQQLQESQQELKEFRQQLEEFSELREQQDREIQAKHEQKEKEARERQGLLDRISEEIKSKEDKIRDLEKILPTTYQNLSEILAIPVEEIKNLFPDGFEIPEGEDPKRNIIDRLTNATLATLQEKERSDEKRMAIIQSIEKTPDIIVLVELASLRTEAKTLRQTKATAAGNIAALQQIVTGFAALAAAHLETLPPIEAVKEETEKAARLAAIETELTALDAQLEQAYTMPSTTEEEKKQKREKIQELTEQQKKLDEEKEALESATPTKKENAPNPEPTPNEQTAAATHVISLLSATNTLACTAAILSCNSDKAAVVSKLKDNVNTVKAAFAGIAAELSKNDLPLDKFNRMLSQLETSILQQSVDFTEPANVTHAACKAVAQQFGIPIQNKGGEEKNAATLKSTIMDVLENQGFSTEQADLMAENAIEFTRLRILTGNYEATKLAGLANEEELTRRASILEERGILFSALDATAPVSIKDAQKNKNAAERKEWLAKNCHEVPPKDSGLYATKLEDGRLFLVLDTISPENINKTISMLSDKKVITWHNIPSKDKEAIQVACMKAGKEALFDDGDGHPKPMEPGKKVVLNEGSRPKLDEFSQARPDNPEELGKWFQGIKPRLGWQSKLTNARKTFVQEFIGEKRLEAFWRDLIKQNDPKLLTAALDCMTKKQKITVAELCSKQLEELNKEIPELEQQVVTVNTALVADQAALETAEKGLVLQQGALKYAENELVSDIPPNEQLFKEYEKLNKELEKQEQELKELEKSSDGLYEQVKLKEKLAAKEKELSSMQQSIGDLLSGGEPVDKATLEEKEKLVATIGALKEKQVALDKKTPKIAALKQKIAASKAAIIEVVEKNIKDPQLTEETKGKWRTLKENIQTLGSWQAAFTKAKDKVTAQSGILEKCKQKLESKKGLIGIVIGMVASKKLTHTESNTNPNTPKL